MKLKALTAAAFLFATTSLVQAAPIDDVLAALEAQGFTITLVQTIDGKIYVASVLVDGRERESVYDAVTGDLLKDEFDGKLLAGSEDYGIDEVSFETDDGDEADEVDDSSDDGEDDSDEGDDASDDSEDDDTEEDDTEEDTEVEIDGV